MVKITLNNKENIIKIKFINIKYFAIANLQLHAIKTKIHITEHFSDNNINALTSQRGICIFFLTKRDSKI